MEDIRIIGYGVLDAGEKLRVSADVDRIFFAASSVQSFEDETQRAAFRWLWLGRYLEREPEHAFVAMLNGITCGYLVGSLADPAPRPEFASLPYFQNFAVHTARFPAHLHINVDDGCRSRGVGEQLVTRFEAHALQSGVAGLHVVTGAGMRNVRFYDRLGFAEVARAPHKGGHVVMLAKALSSVVDGKSL